jgi:hypothetical protein
MRKSFKDYLEIATNVIVLFFAVALLLYFGNKYFSPSIDSYNGVNKKTVNGRTLKKINDLNEEKFKKTLVLVLNTNCPYCTKSVPFYKSLTEAKKPDTSQIVMAFPQPKDDVDKYLQKHNLSVRAIYGANPIDFETEITPTIVAINDKREIINAWFGLLDEKRETEVVNFIQN